MPSSVIRRFDYDAVARTLTITFVSGQRYAYAYVPPEVHEGLENAASRGRFFAAHIRGRYAYRRLGDEGDPPAESTGAPRPSGPASPQPSAAARSSG